MQNTSATESNRIVNRAEWLSARRALLAREKSATRLRDEINAERQALPWVQVVRDYVFDTPGGRKSLAGLFAGRSQLMVYHFMLGPDWKAGCPGCSFLADHLDGALPHLEHHDVSVVVVSRAPLTNIAAYKARMGWRFPWVSSFGSDFNSDFGVSFTPEQLAQETVTYNFTDIPAGQANDELPGLSAFFKDTQGEVFHTYSSYARGDEELIGALMILDRAPKGRNETTTMDFVRRHDEYEDAPAAASCCAAKPSAAGRIGLALRERVAAGDVPGAVVLMARGDDVQVEIAGVQDLATAVPMQRDTIFRIASMTKPITAAAAMILLQEGKIALTDPVERWLPELANRRVLRSMDAPVDDTVPANRGITLEDMLTFRMGVGVIMARPGTYPVQALITELGLDPGAQHVPFTPEDFMARVGRLPLLHQPGERWHYHTAADILCVLIARVSGMKLENFLRERIFAPLGMQDTGFSVPDHAQGRLAAAYRRDGAGGLELWDPGRGGAYSRPPIFPSELVSTADDYLAFARMLIAEGRHSDKPVLTPESVGLMLRDHLTPAQKAASPFAPGFWDGRGWGFGGAVITGPGHPGSPGSYGWMGGIGTSVLIDPAAARTTVTLTQVLMRGPDDAALAEQVQSIAQGTQAA